MALIYNKNYRETIWETIQLFTTGDRLKKLKYANSIIVHMMSCKACIHSVLAS